MSPRSHHYFSKLRSEIWASRTDTSSSFSLLFLMLFDTLLPHSPPWIINIFTYTNDERMKFAAGGQKNDWFQKVSELRNIRFWVKYCMEIVLVQVVYIHNANHTHCGILIPCVQPVLHIFMAHMRIHYLVHFTLKYSMYLEVHRSKTCTCWLGKCGT